MSERQQVQILSAVQECSGLMIRVATSRRGLVKTEWIRPPERGISREDAERLIEEQGVKVIGR